MISLSRICFVMALFTTACITANAQEQKTYTSFAQAFKEPLQVYRLEIRKTQLTTIPPEIGTLVNLRELVLEKNLITSIPPEIGKLVNLEILDLDQNRIIKVPPEIGQLAKLRELDLDQNHINVLPEALGNLTALTDLDIHENRLHTLPSSIGQLKQLKVLLSNNNPLDSLPHTIGQLASLTNINLSHCLLKKIPDAFTNLSKLETINLSYNALTQLPTGPGTFSTARFLYLNGNQLTHLPIAWSSSPTMTTIDLSANQFKTFPQIHIPTNVETFHLDKNNIESIGQNLPAFKRLKWLSLSENKLQTLPTGIEEVPTLVSLILNNNQLTVLPKEIACLPVLSQLHLNSNLLSNLPVCTNSFPGLKSLSIVNNKFTTIPPVLHDLKKLQDLWVDESLLNMMPPEILAGRKVNNINYNAEGTYAIHVPSSQNVVDPSLPETKSIKGNMTAAERDKIWKEQLLAKIDALDDHDYNWYKDFLKENLSYAFTSDELFDMVNKNTGYIKSFAFDILDQRKDKRLLQLIVLHINDPDYLDDYEDNHNRSTGDFFVKAKSLSKQERAHLDSILIFTDNQLNYTRVLVDSLPLVEKYHERLRQMSLTHSYALLKLAAYKNENDLGFMGEQMIKNPMGNLNAIYVFPHPYFKQIIDSIGRDKVGCFYVYPAMVYRDSFSLKHIHQILIWPYLQKNYRYCDAKSMFPNMLTFYTPLYDSILFDTWQNNLHLPSENEIKILCKAHPARAAGILAKALADYRNSRSYTIAFVAKSLLEIDPGLFKKTVAAQLADPDPFDYSMNHYFFLEQVLLAPNEEASWKLMDQFKRSTYSSNIVLTVKAILACNNANVSQELLKVLLHKKHLYYSEQNDIKLLLQEKGLLKDLTAMQAPQPGLWAEWRIVSVKNAKGVKVPVAGHLRLQPDSVYYFSLKEFWYRGKFLLSPTALKPDSITESGQSDESLTYHGGRISYRVPLLATSSVPFYPSAFTRRKDSVYFTASDEKIPVELFLSTLTYTQTDSMLVLHGAGEITLKLYDSWYTNWKTPYEKPEPYTSPYIEKLQRKKLKNIPATIAGKPLSYYLKRNDIDAWSKLYIQGKLAIYEADTLVLRMLDSLNTGNTQTAPFYLQVTNSIIQQARGFRYYSDVRHKLRDVCPVYFLKDPCRFFSQVKFGFYKTYLMDWQKYMQHGLWYNDEEWLQQEAVYYRLHRQCAAYVPHWEKLIKWAQNYIDPERPPEEH